MKKPTILADGIDIPSSTDFLADVDRRIEEALLKAGVDPSIIADVAIAVSELVNNAVAHGNHFDPSKTVEVRFHLSASAITITVSDQGQGFDPKTVPSPVDDENLLREVGRGLFITRNFVDEMQVLPASSGGTCIKIVKKLKA